MSYTPPKLETHGTIVSLTGADLTSAAGDVYLDANGDEVDGVEIGGSGPGCVDGNNNGTCDYLE